MKQLTFQGLPIIVEYDAGDRRPYKDEAGKQQHSTFLVPYGYVRETRGADGEDVDVYVGPKRDATKVYVIRQMKRGNWKTFDEEKVILGVETEHQAKALYLMHYNDQRFFGGIKELTMDEFKKRLETRGKEGKKLAARLADIAFTMRQAGTKTAQEACCEEKPQLNQRARVSEFYVNRAKELAKKELEKKASEQRVQRIANHVDEAGLGILAAPYAAKGIAGALAHKGGRLGAIGAAARKAGDFMHHHENKLELAGLGLVAPGISHRVAKGIDRVAPAKTAELEKVARQLRPDFEDLTEPEKLAYLGAMRAIGTRAIGAARGIINKAPAALGMARPAVPGVPGAPAAAPGLPKAPGLLSGKNVLKATVLGGGALGLYTGKKVVDTASHMLKGEGEARGTPMYQAPNHL